MCFSKTNGRSKIIVYMRVRAHDSEVAGVIRVQEMDLVVAGNESFHGSCCHCRDIMQSVNSKEGG